MTASWRGFDPERILELYRRTVVAAEELAGFGSADPATAETLAVARTVADCLMAAWQPVLRRIATDTTLSSWRPTATRADFAAIVPRPPDGDARAVADWWAGLSGAERQAVIEGAPAAIGNRDGVPAWARDHANRQLLSDDLHRLELAEMAGTLDDGSAARLATARSLRSALADGARFRDPRTGDTAGVQLYLYEPDAFSGDGRTAVVVGDLDVAEHVVITVPGLGTEASRVGLTVQQAIFAAAAAHTTERIAAVAWVGYDAPSIDVADGDDRNPIDDAGDWLVEAGDAATVFTVGRARRGAERLAADVFGIRARRGHGVHLTVLGNSYGSTTVAMAADEFGLAADDVILTGSPGAGRADDAGDLTTGHQHTWVGSASDDPVSYLGRTGGTEPHDLVDVVAGGLGFDLNAGLGHDPAEDDFGARRFRAEWPGRDRDPPWSIAGHLRYFDRCAESLDNIGAIVAGDHDAVSLAEPRHKDESWDVWDPFADLLPRDPEADRPVGDGTCER